MGDLLPEILKAVMAKVGLIRETQYIAHFLPDVLFS